MTFKLSLKQKTGTKNFVPLQKTQNVALRHFAYFNTVHALRCETANTFYLKTQNRIDYQVKPQTKNRYKKLCTVAIKTVKFKRLFVRKQTLSAHYNVIVKLPEILLHDTA